MKKMFKINGVVYRANTRSEARSLAKKMLGLKSKQRLPVKMPIEKIIE